MFAAAFRDRIVHHLIIRELEPYFERYFIGTTLSCMKGRETLHGVEKLASILDERSKHYMKPYYIAKLDYQSFFMSLDKELLRKSLDNFILQNYPDNRKRECLRWLCEMVVLHHPEDDLKVGDVIKSRNYSANMLVTDVIEKDYTHYNSTTGELSTEPNSTACYPIKTLCIREEDSSVVYAQKVEA